MQQLDQTPRRPSLMKRGLAATTRNKQGSLRLSRSWRGVRRHRYRKAGARPGAPSRQNLRAVRTALAASRACRRGFAAEPPTSITPSSARTNNKPSPTLHNQSGFKTSPGGHSAAAAKTDCVKRSAHWARHHQCCCNHFVPDGTRRVSRYNTDNGQSQQKDDLGRTTLLSASTATVVNGR